MIINSLVEIIEKPIQSDQIIFTLKTQRWCQLPYPGHKHGCPNYGKSKYCPPAAPYFKDKIKHYHKFTLTILKFKFDDYKKSMKQIHEEWTDRQLGCVLYYQSQAKKLLKEYLKTKSYDLLLSCGSGFKDHYSMEAVGIDVIKTLRGVGIDIEIKPKQYVHLVCLSAQYKTKRDLTSFF